ncbi:replication factor a 1 rfa1 [Holotrichia oblita]|uniref:Replication factor a 1 rfa1 n=1 Tax=Holotrichia oblita TaxID=644536 RepID=A0ACB9TXN3_HOLOL|nr:replication factor a 1 rfa1 [Holotrichia oblita]
MLLALIDDFYFKISVTLWGQEAENFDGTSNPIIAIKGAKVGEFGGGKNLGTTMNGILKINPDIPEAHRLRGWYDNSGMHKEMKNLSARTGGNFDAQWMNFKEVNVGDFSGNQWLSMFSGEVEKVLGMSAAEVGKAYDEDKSAMTEIANKANFKQFVFRCRAKYEMYNDENRLKTVAVRVEPVNHKEYNNYLISKINQLMGN